MNKIIDKYKRYTWQEWLALIIGTIIWTVQIYRYITNTLNDYMFELGVFAIGWLLLFKPLTIGNFIRKARGLDTK